MITFHASKDGGGDYLDFHDAEGTKFYLGRDEARTLARDILSMAASDVICVHCHRVNGVHQTDCADSSLVLKPVATKPAWRSPADNCYCGAGAIRHTRGTGMVCRARASAGGVGRL